MRLGVFLLILGLFAALGLASFAGLVFYFDPFEANFIIIILAYLTLFFGLIGIISLAVFWTKRRKKSKGHAEEDLIRSFWWGVGGSLFIIAMLLLVANI